MKKFYNIEKDKACEINQDEPNLEKVDTLVIGEDERDYYSELGWYLVNDYLLGGYRERS